MKTPIRAFMISVDYADLLALTLPYNAPHFSEVWVGTTPEDRRTQEVVAGVSNARVYLSRAFYDGGADFNKFLVMEDMMGAAGRRGWMCHLDADVFWPKCASDRIAAMPDHPRVGYLYGCLRRMLEDPARLLRLSDEMLPEDQWGRLPIHHNVSEFAGFTQVYHAEDPALGRAPWHDVCWRHAGGADSFFQQKWAGDRKVRLPFEVLHAGPAGQNWHGRATMTLDGSAPPHPDGAAKTRDLWRERRRSGFSKEKLQ